MRILSYYPQSVLLPRGVCREIQINKNSYDGSGLDERDRAQYDSKTLFYDIFFSTDRRYLICIAPPLLNLGHPTAIYHQSQRLKFWTESIGAGGDYRFALSIIYIRMPPGQEGVLTLNFQFPGFDLAVSYFPRSSISRAAGKITLVAIQKDNPVIWIQDWCKWHKRVHNIGRVAVYDNGSKSLAESRTNLSQLDEDMEIILVHWPFPYGPICSHFNKYAQVGAINHCRLALCDKRSWLLNLDVDEYLYLRSKKPLADYLSFKSYRSVIYLGNYLVPDTQRHSGTLPRFFDYDTRLPDESRDWWAARKYICWVRNIKFNATHHVLFKFSGPSLMKSLKRIMVRAHRSAHKRMNKEIGFYHFKGLAIGWKEQEFKKYKKWKPPNHNMLEKVPDTYIRVLAAKNNMTS